MDSCWSKLNRALLLVAAGAMVLSAAAQDSGQAIIFSTPKSDDPQAVTPSLAPQNSDVPILPSTLLAPVPAFPSGSSLAGDQPLAPMYSSEQQRLKQSQEERRNWTMMTPEEIFGIKSTEKLLQPPERDAFGREKKTTTMERFLERENQSRIGPTNDWRNDRANSPWNLSRDEDNASLFARRPDGTADPAQNLKRFLDSQQNRNVAGNQDGKIDDQAFDALARKKETEEKIEQLAAMQRFRQMLQPGPAPSTESRYFPAPKPVVNPNYTVPEFVSNPAGASFTHLSSSIGRTEGLTPLPGAFTTH